MLAGHPYETVFTNNHNNYVWCLRGMHEGEHYRGRVKTLKLGLQAVLAYVKFRELHATSVQNVNEDSPDEWDSASHCSSSQCSTYDTSSPSCGSLAPPDNGFARIHHATTNGGDELDGSSDDVGDEWPNFYYVALLPRMFA